MFSAVIIHGELVGPFRVKDGVKMTAPIFGMRLKLLSSGTIKKLTSSMDQRLLSVVYRIMDDILIINK